MGNRHRWHSRRRTHKWTQRNAAPEGSPTTLLSVDGDLHDMHADALTPSHATGYSPVEIGQPLMVRYLHFFLKHQDFEKTNELMISTFVKSGKQKAAAAEAVNYYNPNASFREGVLAIRDFGGERYGHDLIYYSKSYRGESLYLTTKIMELDSIPSNTKSAIAKGLTTVGALPMFAEYIPFLAAATAGTAIIAELIDLFNRDDSIVHGHDYDLHFGLMHERRLQSGRILCVPQSSLSKDDLIAGYKLRRDSVLVTRDDATAYTDTSYFVIHVDAKRERDFEDFDHFVGAADLLAETNRGGTVADIVNEVVDLARKAGDIDTIRDMERLAREDDNIDTQQQIKALYKSLSPELQAVYEKRKEEILASKANGQ